MKEFCTKWGKRIATPQMAVVAVLTLAASFIGSWLKQYPGFSLLGALIIALLIGMVIQFPLRSWYVHGDATRAAGVKDAAGLIANKLLRLGIILLGFKLNLELLLTTGAKCLPLAAVIVALTVVVTYAIARWLKVDPMLAILVAGGTGICGAAAVMGISGSMNVADDRKEEKANDEVIAVAIVAIMGVVFALIELVFGPMTGLSKTQLGIVAGGSLHEIAHAVAVGAALGSEGETMAMIMKLSRVLMLVFAAIIIAIWWDKTKSEVKTDGKRKVAFPWFMIGFIVASVIGTILIASCGATGQQITNVCVDIAYILLGMAMAALGINVNFSVLAKRGKNAMLASFIASVLLLGFCVLIAVVFF